MWFISVSIILMNIPVFIITPRLDRPTSATKMTMISLAITDISVGILAVLRLSYFAINCGYYYADDYLCHIDGLLQSILGGVSIISLVHLCVDRVVSIKYPLWYPIHCTKKVVSGIIVGMWVYVTSSLSATHFILKTKVSMKHSLYCALTPGYGSVSTMVAVVLGFFAPACVIFACAVVLYDIVHQQRTQISAIECAVTEASRTQGLMSHVKSIRTIFCMVAGYYICWTPVTILVWLWTYFYGHVYSPQAEAVAGWFAITNSMVNSLVYLPTNREYRETFKQIFLSKLCSDPVDSVD